jgi:hypothetical protein
MFVTSHKGVGGGRQNSTKCHIGWGGGGRVLKVRKKCHVLFEWPLTVKFKVEFTLMNSSYSIVNCTENG